MVEFTSSKHPKVKVVLDTTTFMWLAVSKLLKQLVRGGEIT